MTTTHSETFVCIEKCTTLYFGEVKKKKKHLSNSAIGGFVDRTACVNILRELV